MLGAAIIDPRRDIGAVTPELAQGTVHEIADPEPRGTDRVAPVLRLGDLVTLRIGERQERGQGDAAG